jgi:hypothetical protein
VEPKIIVPQFEGYHNNKNDQSRLLVGKSYQDLSTICIIPSRGFVAVPVVQNWMSMMTPMNQKFFRIFVTNMEVADAYNKAIETILNDQELKTWKYVLTLEDDNLPPADGLIKLYQGTDLFDVIGSLYWTKGEEGQPMIYGDPRDPVLNFRPQIPLVDSLQPCYGLGMGFTLFKLDIFKKLQPPWFKTVQECDPTQGVKMYTQDLYFFEKLFYSGFKVACDTRIKVGHHDKEKDVIW